jgi:hypothetical protein
MPFSLKISHKRNRNFLIWGVMVSLLFSCEGFLDVNQNPNSPVSENLPLSAKLSGALVSAVNQEIGQINQVGAFWGGYWGTNNEASNLFFDLKTYNGLGIRSQREGIPVWENGYNNILFFKLIQTESEASNDLFYAGTAKIMQGWFFLRLVDFYNNVPFDEAALGSQHINPAYEDGILVYRKSVDLITEGILDVKNSNMVPSFNHGDIMFGGQKQLWAKFGNTIKLRALIRQSEVGDLAYINAQINVIQQEGSGFLGLGESAAVNPGYLNTTGKLNPFWENYYRNVQGAETANRQNIRPTQFLIDTYANLNDPRLGKLYTTVGGKFQGVLFGNPDAGNPIFALENTSAFKGPSENNGLPTGLFHSFNQSAVMMSDFESLFLQAEAAQRGWINGNAVDFYNNAIRASFSYTKVSTGLEGYMSQPSVDLASATNPIERIINQKWLAMNSVNSIEAWNDFRRLGIPNFPGSIASGVNGRPMRFMYPETEIGTNFDQVSKQGNDNIIESKIWWMP